MTRDKMRSDEATRDPIFLLQAKRYFVFKTPPDCLYDDEGGIYRDSSKDDDERDYLTNKELESHECAMHYWETISVWYDREEAESFAKSTKYRYPDGWRVYCVCAEGKLAELLNKHGDAEK